ncbi:SGNH/GDSL hydrolase family protein [Fibrisoma montanum]|uniref:SGNH/GDSL hydrolase family protein n=1 Tax=Fibrisoma montanum TaxID=2305895 RepID=A0A418M4C4_9BACT|nr:SGNH/GDSL hydrolase family protein [Fibrisoma montanum]RIV20513.1 SGNH/GDSL hydrolase family protein [Fibrisoma montanum]
MKRVLYLIAFALLGVASQAQQPGFPTYQTQPVSISGTVPVTVGNSHYLARIMQPEKDRMRREGMRVNQAYTTYAQSLTVTPPQTQTLTINNNTAYFSYTPQVGNKTWFEEINVSVSEPTYIALQWQNSPLNIAGFAANYDPVYVTPNQPYKFTINNWVYNNETIAITQVGSFTTTQNFWVRVGVSAAVRTTMDFGRNAEKVILKIHDSILNGSGPSSWEDYFDARLRTELQKVTGKTWEIIGKGNGGFTSSQIEAMRSQGEIRNIIQPDIILYEPMMNDNDANVYDANLAKMIAEKQTYFPGALMFVIGITPRSDANESILAQCRAKAEARVLATNDNRVILVNMGDLWSPGATPSSYWVDSSPPYVHPNATGHGLMFTRLWSRVSPVLHLIP